MSTKKKKLEELTLKDNFMFGAVMCMEDNCRQFLELVLGFPIEEVKVSKEKCIVYHPEYKGVRLDVYAEGEKNTHYNVEMQVAEKPALGKRSRYYHSQADMELLESGTEYAELPNAYVIFVCDFDPFGWEKYCYTFQNRCEEVGKLSLADGCKTIFLSTEGKNSSEVPKELVKLLEFVKADLAKSQMDFQDEYVRKLQDSVKRVKESREMGERFMVFEEMMREERNEGRREGIQKCILDLLAAFGEIPEELKKNICSETREEKLSQLFVYAAKSGSLEEFVREAGVIFSPKER